MQKEIKAILINPAMQTVSEITVPNRFDGPNGIYHILGCDTIEHGPRLDNGDVLLCDENGAFRVPVPYVFVFDDAPRYNVPGFPYCGRVLIVGIRGEDYTDHASTLEDIRARVLFATRAI